MKKYLINLKLLIINLQNINPLRSLFNIATENGFYFSLIV